MIEKKKKERKKKKKSNENVNMALTAWRIIHFQGKRKNKKTLVCSS
jgi:hypothetical protein